MPLKKAAALMALVLSGVTSPQGRNPVLAGADPHMTVICDRYWIYPTSAADPMQKPQAQRFYGFSSRDLRSWTRSAPLLDMRSIGWIDDDGAPRHYLWAPALAQANGRFYLYYAVGPQNPTPSRIGVAVADRPEGPFRDSGRPLLTGGDGFEAIDPMVFRDPAGGKTYLYAGGSAGATLRMFELAPGMTAIAREIDVGTPRNFTEGAFMHFRKGIYYLSYSHGRWNHADYSVHYATSRSPDGPWRYRGAILTSDARHKGPGHHSIVNTPGTEDWFIAYHRWEGAADAGPFTGARMTAVQRLTHASGGKLEVIRMTEAPPKAAILNPQCRDDGATSEQK